MEKRSVLLFGIHMHQPVDNFDETIERAVESCYAPFFSTMKSFGGFRFSLHCSGWLLQKIASGYPSLFEDMREISARGDIEWIGAGYYEPILSSIPSKDRVGQIEMLNTLLEKLFGKRACGLWLTERVWESSLVSDLVKAGMKFSMIDDYHFLASGFEQERLDGYYFTEDSGEKIALFPISRKLRYAIPFESPKSSIEAIKEAGNSANGAAIIFDDAEKFGMWPRTHDWVYGRGWLEKWLSSIMQDEEIVTMHYSEYLESHRARGIAYLPNVSYFEMGEWSLEADDAVKLEEYRDKMGEELFESEGVKFLKGGIWKNFFVKYEESNRLHKRMLELSGRKYRSAAYKDALYRLQTNDVFWHGVFGGLYLPNLRDNAYRYLCICENIHYKDREAIELYDCNMDGYDEVKAVSADMIARFDSANGGQLVELLHRKSLFNFQNVLRRRKEAYHEKILRAEDAEEEKAHTDDSIDTIHTANAKVSDEIREALIYDWYPKNSFIDHISDDSLNLESVRECRFWEYGDFANQPFVCRVDEGSIEFVREGGIYFDRSWRTILKKRYEIEDNKIAFTIDLHSESPERYIYALELNLHFADISEVEIDGVPFAEERTIEGLDGFTLHDPYTATRIRFESGMNFTLYACALRTVSQSEEGYELTTQGMTLMLAFPFHKSSLIEGKMEIEDV